MLGGGESGGKVIDDEYLSSIKDFTKGSPIIYSTNNPVMDDISPSMLWKASPLSSSAVTVNKILPVTTTAGVGGNGGGRGSVTNAGK